LFVVTLYNGEQNYQFKEKVIGSNSGDIYLLNFVPEQKVTFQSKLLQLRSFAKLILLDGPTPEG